jgi:hypothetical protein
MDRINKEAYSDSWSEDILRLCEDEPFNFMAFRVYVLLHIQGKMPSNPAPFIHRIWYLPIILLYISLKRIQWVLTDDLARAEGHIFCCTSTEGYRSESFFELVQYFTEEGEETTLYCTSRCKKNFYKNFSDDITNIVTYSQTFQRVSLTGLVLDIPMLWSISTEMYNRLEVSSWSDKVICLNFLITEHIKYRGLSKACSKIDSFHTYSPMPYQIKSIESEKIYVHQHGLQATPGDRAMAIPKYSPVNYFVFGQFWSFEFKKKSHPQSKIFVTGNPRYDSLFKKPKPENPKIDVLFVSGTHILDRSDFEEDNYKSLVDLIINVCDRNNLDVSIKLHPKETDKYYRKWGYENKIVQNEDITQLLSQSRIAVTDVSTAFIESILLQTPFILAKQSSIDLAIDGADKINGLVFAGSLKEVENKIESLNTLYVSKDDIKSWNVVDVGNSKGKILNIVSN